MEPLTTPGATVQPPNVRFLRAELRAELPKWRLIRDCLAGEEAVKASAELYLPRPNAEDKSSENKARYQAYVQRAVFYNATKRTLDGLVGQVYLRDPTQEIPESLKFLMGDVDGAGIGLHEQSKKTLADTVSFGRVGLFVDYPPTDGTVTKAQQEAGYVRPVILSYAPESVLNWRTVVIGARRLLSLVVLQESFLSADDGFQPYYQYQWRVLKLVPTDKIYEGEQLPPGTQHEYRVEIWRDIPINGSPGQTQTLPIQSYTPLDASGKPMDQIPFVFVGSLNNDSIVDPAPLYDLSILNIAHYRNSADYEESCFIVGQPTVYASGLTESWVKEVMGGAVSIGSRSIIPLPVGGQAGLLQVNPNSLPKEAMDQKERQMVALGARLVEQSSVAQTLGEAQQKEAAQVSILASVAKNVGTAYSQCLKWCAQYHGVDTSAVRYDLNTDFIAAQMTPSERAQLVAEWVAGAISYTEMRSRLRKAGVATQTDEEAKVEAEEDELRVPEKEKVDPNADPNSGRVAPKQDGKTQKGAGGPEEVE
jgi:hypothetical protein